MIHGLNLLPWRMDPLARQLNEGGIDVLQVALSGHGEPGSLEQLKNASRERWLEEILRAYEKARAEALTRELPLHLVGYSVGALFALDLMSSQGNEEIRFDRMALFAPALALTRLARLTRLLGFLDGSRVVPSFSELGYKANFGTSIAAYRAVFRSIHTLLENGIRPKGIRTLVVIDPRDKVISYPGLRELAARQGLTGWRFLEISNSEGALSRFSHHLIIDEAGLGARAWRELGQALREHFAPADQV